MKHVHNGLAIALVMIVVGLLSSSGCAIFSNGGAPEPTLKSLTADIEAAKAEIVKVKKMVHCNGFLTAIALSANSKSCRTETVIAYVRGGQICLPQEKENDDIISTVQYGQYFLVTKEKGTFYTTVNTIGEYKAPIRLRPLKYAKEL